jgi:ATP-dependent RNA helicase RhlE
MTEIEEEEEAEINFSDLGLTPSIAANCEALGYVEPTPIQEEAIPVVLSGADLIGCASTGTGKTAAFLLPLLQMLQASKGAGVRVLVLAPTRELAGQIADNLRELDPKKLVRATTVIGGESMNKQVNGLRSGARVVIATPGRLQDHLEQGTINLARVEHLVLDEADRMLDMGFLPAIQTIMDYLPEKRQTLLFSATMSREIEGIAREYMRKPVIIEVNPRGKAALTVKQTAYPVATASKTSLLLHLLESEPYSRVLVFTRTKRGAERLSHLLAARDHKVDCIHADRTQPQRKAALLSFKNGQCHVLVATDIAARGIDVDSITHVINFDVPEAPEDYIHRIGRTGRAGNAGHALTLLTPIDELTMTAIERLTGQKVERVLVPGFGGLAPVTLSRTRAFRSRRPGR